MLAFALSTGSFALDLHYTYTTSSSCCYGQKGYRGVVEGKRNTSPRQTEKERISISRYLDITALPITYCLFAPLRARNSTCLTCLTSPTCPLYTFYIYTTPPPVHSLLSYSTSLHLRGLGTGPSLSSKSAIRSALPSSFASSLLPHPPTSTHCSLLRFPSLILQKRCQSASKSETLVRSESTHTYCTRPASRNRSLFKPDRTRFPSKSGRPASQ